jgi:serine/threonine protein kinase
VLHIGREAAAGLAAVHAADVIHRDIKPANIWLEAVPGEPGGSSPRSRVKLLDFGLAREQREGETITYEGVVVGTPAYMSPEQADGQPLDVRSDLFSLGSVLYECATGQRPFRGKSHTAILTAVAQSQPPAAHEVSPSVPLEVSRLIAGLMAKSPADRPASARAVVEAIRALDAGSKTVPLPPLAKPRVARGVGPWIAAAVGVVLVGVISALAYTHWTTSPPADSRNKTRQESPRDSRPDSTRDTAAAPLATQLDVRIWRKEDKSRGLELSAPGALPLRTGDYMRIEVESNRPAYLYVIYVDTRGEASPMFPWNKYDWDQQRPPQKLGRLNLPEDPQKDGAPLDPGPSGIEAVLLIARDEPLGPTDVARLREPFRTKPAPAKFDPLRAAVWLGAEERFANNADRGRPNFDGAGVVLDPVERMRRLVGTELKGLGGDVRGVCYPFAGQ